MRAADAERRRRLPLQLRERNPGGDHGRGEAEPPDPGDDSCNDDDRRARSVRRQPPARDGRQRLPVARPLQLDVEHAAGLYILQEDEVRTAIELHALSAGQRAVLAAVVDHKAPIHMQPRPVVGGRRELVKT